MGGSGLVRLRRRQKQPPLIPDRSTFPVDEITLRLSIDFDQRVSSQARECLVGSLATPRGMAVTELIPLVE